MEPATRNFSVVENDTFIATLTLTDVVTGNPIDLTGATPKMQLRTKYSESTVALEFSLGAGLTMASPATGTVNISKSIALAAGEYVYDFQVTFPGAIVLTYLRGRFKVMDEATT